MDAGHRFVLSGFVPNCTGFRDHGVRDFLRNPRSRIRPHCDTRRSVSIADETQTALLRVLKEANVGGSDHSRGTPADDPANTPLRVRQFTPADHPDKDTIHDYSTQ